MIQLICNIILMQSSTMPVLSLHNSSSLPTGSASYTIGLSGAPNVVPFSYRTPGEVSDRIIPGASMGIANICTTSGLNHLSSTLNPLGILLRFSSVLFDLN